MTSVYEQQKLEGRLCIVTGAAGGLGQVISDSLGELGANLILVDKSSLKLKPIKSKLEKKWNIRIWIYECDLEDEDERVCLIDSITSQHKSINCLINNAAFLGASDLSGWNVPFEEQSLETWRRAFEVNLTAIFHLSQAFTPYMISAPGANIINIASIYGEYGPDWSLYEGAGMANPAAYSASKGGLIQLTRWLATTLAPMVRVNAISPGGILRGQPNKFIKRYEDKTPMKRMATEEDMRGAIVFLASNLSAYVTGQIISVDGGWGVW